MEKVTQERKQDNTQAKQPSEMFEVRRERNGIQNGRPPVRREAAERTERRIGRTKPEEQENRLKLRVLWSALGVLSVLLVIALVYEIALGNGTKETGAQRMTAQEHTVTVGEREAGAVEEAGAEE